MICLVSRDVAQVRNPEAHGSTPEEDLPHVNQIASLPEREQHAAVSFDGMQPDDAEMESCRTHLRDSDRFPSRVRMADFPGLIQIQIQIQHGRERERKRA
jgi:hypothetical protein